MKILSINTKTKYQVTAPNKTYSTKPPNYLGFGSISEQWPNTAPKPLHTMAINTLEHFKKSDYKPKNIKLETLSELTEELKTAKTKEDFSILSLKASLKGKNLFIEGIEENNKQKVVQAKDYFAFSLKIQDKLFNSKYKDEKTQDTRLAKALDLTRAFVVLNKPDNAQNILDYYSNNTDKDIKKKYKPALAVLQKQIGVCHFNNKKQAKAVDSFQKAIEIFKLTNNQSSICECKNYLGRSYLMQKKYDEAIETFNDVIEHYKNIQNSKGIAKAKSYMAKAYSRKGNYPKAIKLNKEVLEHSNEFQNSKFIIFTTDHLGQCYLYNNQPDKAIPYFKKSLKANNINDLSRAYTHTNIANAYYKKGALNNCLKHKLYFVSFYLKTPNASFEDKKMKYFKENVDYLIKKLSDKELINELKNLDFNNKKVLKYQVDYILDKHFDDKV